MGLFQESYDTDSVIPLLEETSELLATTEELNKYDVISVANIIKNTANKPITEDKIDKVKRSYDFIFY